MKRERDEGGESAAEDDGILVRIDKKVLLCSICDKQLQLPVVLCKNGHVACSKCNCNIKKRCPQCASVFIACPGLGTIIKAIKVCCPNSSLGCSESISDINQDLHLQCCPHTPCFCPLPACAFKGPVPVLLDHIRSQHPAAMWPETGAPSFLDWLHWSVSFKQEDPFVVLQGRGRLFLLINNRSIPYGYSLSMLCLGPGSAEKNFRYELGVRMLSSNTVLGLEAPLLCTKEWKGDYPAAEFLFVPGEFFTGSTISVAVDI